jgi:hypothetical protein
MTSLELHFKHPATILLSGPTGCGKTRFVRRILEERLIEPFPTRLLWVYGEWQSDYDEAKIIYPEIEFMNGYTDDIYDSLEPTERNLLILDDQMSEASDTKSLAKLFTKGSHHRNVTILYLVQNMFDQGKSSRTVSLNSHYTVVFRNLRDQSQFRTMAHQLLPKNSQWLVDAFTDATERPYGYLVIDNSPQCNPVFRFRTNIFRGELPTVYCDSSAYKRPRTENKSFPEQAYVQIKIEKSTKGAENGKAHGEILITRSGKQDCPGDSSVVLGRLNQGDLQRGTKRPTKPDS